MLRAFLNALFIVLFVRLVFSVARLLVGGRRSDEIPPGSVPGRPGGRGRGRRRSGSRRVPPAEIVDVPFTEIPPTESPKRT